jgi:uncharacterized protein YprB with RNaseH-like and TPR domain
MPASISDRLKALGVKVGAQDLKPAPPVRSNNLENILDGHSLETPWGETFVIEKRYPVGQPHGSAALQLTASLERLADWAGDARIRAIAPEALAFLDTETTGLAGGTGTYAFVIGVARIVDEELHIRQFFMRDPAEEPAQLIAFESFLAPCQAIVTFNGKAFDAPLLATRFVSHGLRAPFLELAHIDLLHLARRLWRDRLPSRTLGNLEVQILGALRTAEDIPGWMIPSVYFNYLHTGDTSQLKDILYHNRMDVLSLVALLEHVGWLLADPLQFGGEFSIDLIALGKLFEDLGDLETATQLYIHGLEHEDTGDASGANDLLPPEILLQALQRLAAIHKRQAHLEAAIQVWEQAARYTHIEAHIELAKTYEHHLKDYTQAIYWTETAISLIESSSTINGQNPYLNAYQKRQWLVELQHRLERLQRKNCSKGRHQGDE